MPGKGKGKRTSQSRKSSAPGRRTKGQTGSRKASAPGRRTSRRRS